MQKIYFIAFILLLIFGRVEVTSAQADTGTYLKEIKAELQKQWPKNRTINLVFHGHSVPCGYARTPLVKTFDSYPFLLLKQLKSLYPYAVINVIITSIGGENSVQGQKRFKRDVLIHKPDVLFIDYALNDRSVGLKKSKVAMEKMRKKALRKNIKIILLTPSNDLTVDFNKPGNQLEQFSNQLISLAKKYNIGLSDSYGAFRDLARSGEDLKSYMAQSNHPNELGHEVITNELIKWFK
jgi:lysophospholipase L1-like esterase